MIDFQVQPRQSGKTQEIIRLYRETGGKIILPNFSHLMVFTYDYPDIKKDLLTVNAVRIHTVLRDIEYLYFDEFLAQDQITCEDLIRLDRPGANIVVRTSILYEDLPEYFTDYLKENYPEYCI